MTYRRTSAAKLLILRMANSISDRLLARAIEDQQLMFDEDGLGNYGTDPARTRKSGDGREEMDEKDHEIAHIRIIARNRKLAEFRAN